VPRAAAFAFAALLVVPACRPEAPPPPPQAHAPDQKLDAGLNAAHRAIEARQFEAARAAVAQYLRERGSAARLAQAEFLLGLSFHEERKNADALAHFDRCAELEPGYLANHYYRGMCALDLGQVAKARASFESYLAVEPQKVEAIFGMALVELEEGRNVEAQSHLEHAIALTRKRLTGPGDLADARRDLGRYLARLGDACTRTNELAQARKALEESVRLLPDLSEPRAKLQHVLELQAAGGSAGSSPGAAAAVARTIHFTDVTAQSGIDFALTSGRFPPTQILEVKGGGLALVDYDNDGDDDLFVPNGAYLDAPEHGPGARLFENLGGMKFRDVTKEAGIEFQRWGQGVAVGDFDGDGFDDLYIACFGKDALLRNTGHGTFVDVTDAAGLGDTQWSTGASFGDLDGDGDLDLYVANYLVFDPQHPPAKERFHEVEVFGGPLTQTPEPDVLWENLGDGRFRDASESSGIHAVKSGLGLGALILDFDGDGKQDIFVGNDSTPKFFFKNLGGLRFEELGMRAGVAVNADGAAQATMGIAVGDVNGDGQPDLFTTNFSDDTNTLFVSVPGRALWNDATQSFGLGAVSRPFVGWSTWFADLDLDGDEDLVVFDGHVYPQATPATMNSSFKQTALLFSRQGSRFERVLPDTAGAWLAEEHCDRSAVFGDLDGDGDTDIIVGELDGKLRVLRNDAVGGHWLEVALHDGRKESKNHRGLGAKLVLRSGAATQTRWIFSGGSYQAASSTRAHFGLATASPVELEVRWPDGTVQHLKDFKIDRQATIEHP
jgi:tetratricopeptide (TPR) repeat protein